MKKDTFLRSRVKTQSQLDLGNLFLE